MLNNDIKVKILDFIKLNENMCSCMDISKELKINRVTLIKYLSVLESEGLINYKEIGMAKVWFLQKNNMLNNFQNGNGKQLREMLNLIGEGVCITDNNNKIVWMNKIAKINYCKKDDYVGGSCCEVFNCGDLCIKGDIKKILSEKGIYKYECEVKDGSKIRNIEIPLIDNNEVVGSIRVMIS